MRTTLVNLALVIEAALVVWMAYVLYRWWIANAGGPNAFADLIPYRGPFAVVVAPLVAACAVIPLALIVVAIAGRLRRKSN